MTKYWRKRRKELFKILVMNLLAVALQAWSFSTERYEKMEEQSKQVKSTGCSQPIKEENESVSAPVESMESKKASPVSINVPSREESLTSTVAVSASNLLAIQILMGDFIALKEQLPKSRQASSNGKIYWCAEMPGHVLSVSGGNLLVDGQPVDSLLQKILAQGSKNTGG